MKIKRKIKNNLVVKKQGFSLLELVIIIAIISIMTAIALVAINSSKGRVELETAANEVKSVLRETQNYALTGKVDSSGCARYTFSTTAGSSEYNVSGEDSEEVSCGFSVDYNLNRNVQFQNNENILFLAPHAEYSGSDPVHLNRGTNNIYICINSAGLIEISESSCP